MMNPNAYDKNKRSMTISSNKINNLRVDTESNITANKKKKKDKRLETVN